MIEGGAFAKAGFSEGKDPEFVKLRVLPILHSVNVQEG